MSLWSWTQDSPGATLFPKKALDDAPQAYPLVKKRDPTLAQDGQVHWLSPILPRSRWSSSCHAMMVVQTQFTQNGGVNRDPARWQDKHWSLKASCLALGLSLVQALNLLHWHQRHMAWVTTWHNHAIVAHYLFLHASMHPQTSMAVQGRLNT